MQQIKDFFKEIGGCETIHWRGSFSPLLLLFNWNDEKYYKDIYRKTPVSPVLQLLKGRETDYLFNDDYYSSYAAEMLEKYLDKKSEVEEINKRSEEIAEKIKTWYLELMASDMEKMSELRLIEEVNRFNDSLSELVACTIHIEKFDESTLQTVLLDKSRTVLDRIWEKATHPYFENFENRRLRLTLEVLEKGLTIATREARFMFTDYFETKDDVFIEEKLKRISVDKEKFSREVIDHAEELKKNIDEFEKWLTTLTEEEKQLAQYIQMVMAMRDWRKDPIAQAQAAFTGVAKEFFRRAGIDMSHIAYVTPNELSLGVGWLERNKDDIAMRSNGVLLSMNNGKCTVSLVDHAKAQAEIEAALKKYEISDEIIGRVGAKGFAKGRVKVVMNITEANKFSDGDILVTGMTRPEFVPLMKKAIAIITDEGGITCHAAIVSRELKKPCVIGTKNASKILKDGDLVEVDANSGAVKILNRSNR